MTDACEGRKGGGLPVAFLRTKTGLSRPWGFALAALGLATLGGLTAWAALSPPLPAPETVRIAAGDALFRPAGSFRIGTRAVDAPLESHPNAPSFEIMRTQVSAASYAACIADAGCPDPDRARQTYRTDRADLPRTGVSYEDAIAYALWLSRRTGQHWRLPTDLEWRRAAGERATDDALGAGAGGADPSKRWLENYRREVTDRGAADPVKRPLGGFGVNSLGVADMAGNVWEWTESCFVNANIGADGATINRSDYCGVRLVEGRHRTFIITFVRDAKSGGCALGLPPDYLGFRLVRD